MIFKLFKKYFVIVIAILIAFTISTSAETVNNFWIKGSNGQLYTNSGNGQGNAIINVAGCNGCGGGGGGGVTSVGLALPSSIFNISGSPVTTSGTLTATFDAQSANTFFAGPASGAANTPTFRTLTADDIPSGISAVVTDGETIIGTGVTGDPLMVQIQDSIISDSSGLSLDGDQATPGNNKYYGTNGSGVKSWYRSLIGSTSAISSETYLGLNAGQGANPGLSVYIGEGAGRNATNAGVSEFIGYNAGQNATNAVNSAFIGFNAGNAATNANQSVFIGNLAGQNAVNSRQAIYIGSGAGSNDTVNTVSPNGTAIAIGKNAGTGGFANSIALGSDAVNTATNQFLIGTTYTQLNMRGVNYTMPSSLGAANTFLTDVAGNGVLSWGVPDRALNLLTAATGTNTINNGSFSQTWNFNSLTTNTGMTFGTNSTTAGNGQTVFGVVAQGTNAASNILTNAMTITNNHTGTGATNVGLTIDASGAATNYALLVPSGAGNVGIGNSAPSNMLTLGTSAVPGDLGLVAGSGNVTSIQPAPLGTAFSFILPVGAGSSGEVLKSNGAGQPMSWGTVTATPAGSSGDVQFNNGSSFGAESNFNWNSGSNTLAITGIQTIDAGSSTAITSDSDALRNIDVIGNVGTGLVAGTYLSSGGGGNYEAGIFSSYDDGTIASFTQQDFGSSEPSYIFAGRSAIYNTTQTRWVYGDSAAFASVFATYNLGNGATAFELVDPGAGTNIFNVNTQDSVVSIDQGSVGWKFGFRDAAPTTPFQVMSATAYGWTVASTSTNLDDLYTGWAYDGAGSDTFSLPDPTTVPGRHYVIKNRGGGDLKIDVQGGGSTIYTSGAVPDIALTTGESATFDSDGTYWNVID